MYLLTNDYSNIYIEYTSIIKESEGNILFLGIFGGKSSVCSTDLDVIKSKGSGIYIFTKLLLLVEVDAVGGSPFLVYILDSYAFKGNICISFVSDYNFSTLSTLFCNFIDVCLTGEDRNALD